jgi:cold shock CspA family protein
MPRGTVTAFDEYVGLGEVQSDLGEAYLFHCVEIADGSRTIDIGATVEFDIMRKFGRSEASRLRPVCSRESAETERRR